MPLEERLRTALADRAATVLTDPQAPLERVRRRRTRTLTAWSAGAAAAVVAVVATAGLLATEPPGQPEPVGPPAQREDPPPRPIPYGTYARTVTDDEVLDAGFPRESVDVLFGGAGRARAELVLRDRTWTSEQEGWALRFVGARGERRTGERGYYHPTGATSYEHDGELVLVGTGGVMEPGFNYVFTWELEAGSLAFEPVPETTDRPTAVLLGEGTWERQRR